MASEPSAWAMKMAMELVCECRGAPEAERTYKGHDAACSAVNRKAVTVATALDSARTKDDAAGYERGVREGEARAKLNALCAIRADAVREREGIRNCGNRITEAMAGGAWDSLIQTLDCMIHRARGEPQADGKGGA